MIHPLLVSCNTLWKSAYVGYVNYPLIFKLSLTWALIAAKLSALITCSIRQASSAAISGSTPNLVRLSVSN